MATITKKELTDRVAEKTRYTRGSVKQTLQAFLDLVVEELAKGNRIEFREFGVFEVRERSARIAQNPKTLQRVEVPAKRTVKFKVGRVMREHIDASTAEFPPTPPPRKPRNNGSVLAVQVKTKHKATAGV
jgi:integration host factor subunit beta